MQTTAAALSIHITAGLIAITGGLGALAFTKGSQLHRAAGLIFFWSMVVMSAAAAYLGYVRSELNDIVAAITIVYLVATARWALQGPAIHSRILEAFALLLALGITAANAIFAIGAAAAGGTLYGLPATVYWISAGIVALAAALDLNFVLRGDLPPKHRLARHLWRMCFALWVAVASFFLGQMKVFPEPLRNLYLLAAPVLLVAVAMIYGLTRVLIGHGPQRERSVFVPQNESPRSATT